MVPEEAPPPSASRLKKWGLGFLLGAGWVIGAWLIYFTSTFFFGPLSLLIVPWVPVGCWLLWRKKRWIAIACLVLANPLVYFFGTGVANYWSAHPTRWGKGLPHLESFNLNPESRCFWNGGGCVVRGWEWVPIDSHNCGLRQMVTLLGPPPKTYHGPYPTQEEALAFVQEAAPTDRALFRKGKMIADGEEIDLGTNVTDALIQQLECFDDPDFSKGLAQSRIYKERCLIVRLSVPPSDPSDPCPNDLMVLFEKGKKIPFAYFSVSGNAQRFPLIRPE